VFYLTDQKFKNRKMGKNILISKIVVVAILLIIHGCDPKEKQTITTNYTLTVVVSPTNGGSVTLSPTQSQYLSGTTVMLTAIPASGYQFTRWEGSVTGTFNPTSIPMNGDKNVTAVFTAISQYPLNITISPTNGGSVTKSPNQTQYTSGTIVTLTAVPASGYQFTRWEGNITGTSNPTTITMNGDKNVTAVFTTISPTIQLSSTSLTFTATSGGAAPSSQTVNITNGGGGTLSGLSRTFPDGTPTWLFANLNNTSAPTQIAVSVSMQDPFGHYFSAGTYTSRIAIASSNASNNPQYINVTLTLLPPASLISYASYDNAVMISSIAAQSNLANTVYSSTELGVGIDYGWLIYGGYNYLYTATAIKFDIQSQISGRSIKSATLRLYVYSLRGDFSLTPKIRVNAFAGNWSPSTLTYNSWSTMSIYTPTGQVEINAPSSSSIPLDFDVTTIVKNWASGSWTNYGFSLSPQNHYYPNYSSLQTTYFQSLEKYYSSNQRPQIIIQFN
jgi:hypothetical protein